MTAYLQRLLGRSAGLAAAPAAGEALRPILPSQSPVIGFDQRLADPALAEDFAIIGASPEGAEATEPELGGPLDTPSPDLARPVPTRRRNARQEAPIETPAPSLDAIVAQLPAAPPAPAESTQPPRRDGRARRQPFSPDIVALNDIADPVMPEPALRPSHPVAHAEPQVQAATPPPAIRAEPALATPVPPAPSLPSQLEPAARIEARDTRPLPASVSALAPRPVAAPPEPAAFAFAPDRQIATLAEPVLAPAQPLPPLPQQATSLSRAEIEQIVRDTIGAERKAQPAAAPAATQQRDATPAPAPRPATAAEASVIGKLESSTFRPMLFGVRRR